MFPKFLEILHSSTCTQKITIVALKLTAQQAAFLFETSCEHKFGRKHFLRNREMRNQYLAKIAPHKPISHQ